MAAKKGLVVTGYVRMWPREIFDIKVGKKWMVKDKNLRLLEDPGVYVLFRDDHPYYIGQASKKLCSRIWRHAKNPKDRYYYLWNFFSAFAVPRREYLDEIEAVLIAASPTENKAEPKLKRIHLPPKAGQILAKRRRIDVDPQS